MKTSDLHFALKLAQPCIVGIDLIPVLQHFCFEPGRVFSYDEVSAIIVKLDSELHCALRASTLLPLLELAGEKVTLTEKGGTVYFASDNTKAELPAMPPERFVFEEPRAQDKTTMRLAVTQELLDALELCGAGVGKDPRFAAQTSVVLVTGKTPLLYATDGTGLIRIALSKALGNEERTVLIPKSVCDQIAGVIKALEVTPEAVVINLSRDHLAVDFEHDVWSVHLVGKLLSEKVDLDEYEFALGEASKGRQLLPLAEGFAQAVAKVAIVMAGDVEKACNLEVKDGSFTVSGVGSLGSAKTVLKGNGGKGVASAAVDPEHLSRYAGRFTHVMVDKERVAMYDNKSPAKARLSYVIACF